jgi:hypothetical protein
MYAAVSIHPPIITPLASKLWVFIIVLINLICAGGPFAFTMCLRVALVTAFDM